MKLGEHIRSKNMTVAQWSAEHGFAEQSIVKYIAGARVPRPDQMRRLFEETEGEVTPNDFYDLPHDKKAA